MRTLVFIASLAVGLCFASPTDASGLPASREPKTTMTERSDPEGRITFAADGRIYVVNVDSSGLRMIVDGSNAPQDGLERRIRLPDWAAAPAFSPDGTLVAFVRDLDVWVVNADGSEQRLLGDVSDFIPSPGASNGTIGASSVAWSPDGSQVAYMLSRSGGSGISGGGVVDVATGEVHRLHGRNIDSGGFMTVSWLPDGGVGIVLEPGILARIDPVTGDELAPLPLPKPAPWPASVQQAANGALLMGSFVSDAAILYGQPGAMTEIGSGLSPTFSPDQEWVAYFKGDTIRAERTNGLDDREVLDLTPLGGRDRHFASTPDCYPERNDSCSYRAPTLSWAAP